MRTALMTTIASAIILSVLGLAATGAVRAGPIVPQGHDCIEYAEGGTDCSFTSYAQCEATASGLAAECYGPPVFDNEWRRWKFPGIGR